MAAARVGLLALLVAIAPRASTAASVGAFEDHGDVGTVTHAGSVTFDPATGAYRITGSGENMWFAADAFHFVWKRVSSAGEDMTLTADVTFVGSGKNPHRKACLMFRQSQGADSAYADVALHGDGLTSLQYRDERGATTHEVQANQSKPTRLRIEKRGAYVAMSLGDANGTFQPSGAAVRIDLREPFYVGLGVCSHEKDTPETAIFSNVEFKTTPAAPSPAPAPGTKPMLRSTLETVTIASTDRRVVHTAAEHFEAPNWTPDGKTLIFNGGGRLFRIPVGGGGKPEPIDTGFAMRCNNDHGVSPDGKTLVISDQSQPPNQSIIYTLPIDGGAPQRITQGFPSYWHGWSPDGKTLAFCGQRDGVYGIFTIPAAGGAETRLTTAIRTEKGAGLDDGPDYSPDGKHIYFNSDRTGLMQIWRMRVDGGGLEQLTKDDANNWFPHPSPDGKQLVMLTYAKDVDGHPANKDVTLRVLSLNDGKITVLAKLFGGQGTINVPSWSPDGKRLAFVSYQLVP